MTKPYVVKILNFLSLTLFIGLFMMVSNLSFGQGTDATIYGKISDEKGEAIPGVTVKIKNESTGFQSGTVSNVNGEYQLQQLPLGKPYSVTFSFVGYQTLKFSDYAVNQGDKVRIDGKLVPSNTQLSEVVVSANSFVNKETARAGAAIAVTSLQMKQLPMEGRNFTALTALSSSREERKFWRTTYFIDQRDHGWSKCKEYVHEWSCRKWPVHHLAGGYSRISSVN